MAGVSTEAKASSHPRVWRLVGVGALCGLLAGYAALATAEFVSAAVRPESSPVVAVGGAAIDRTPAGVKDWA
ncbi:molybdopterin-binding oxidoreductase, partial [Streptomyces sp. NPDC057888]